MRAAWRGGNASRQLAEFKAMMWVEFNMDEQTRLFIEARFAEVVAAEAAGRLLDDADVWRAIEAEFGPLGIPPDIEPPDEP